MTDAVHREVAVAADESPVWQAGDVRGSASEARAKTSPVYLICSLISEMMTLERLLLLSQRQEELGKERAEKKRRG